MKSPKNQNTKKGFKTSSSIKFKTNLILSAVLIVAFFSLTILVYSTVHSRIEKDTHDNMVSHLKDLKTILNNHFESQEQNLNAAIMLADALLVKQGNIKEKRTLQSISATNKITKETKQYTIHQWQLNNKLLYNSSYIIDNITSQFAEVASIFQKIDDGYLCIATNVLNEDSTKTVGTFIPNSLEVIKTIEEGKTFYERSYVMGNWYLAAYKPIVINKMVKGILYIGIEQMNYPLLKKVFSEKKYFKDGYPFLVKENGDLIIHPSSEGQNVSKTNFFKQLKHNADEVNKSEYLWPELGKSRDKIQYYTYFNPYKSYISVSIYKEDMYGGLYKLLRLLTVVILACGILVFIVLNRFLSPIIYQMRLMANKAELIAKGDLTVSVYSERTDELGRLANALNLMIDTLKKVVNEIAARAYQINSSGSQFDSTSQDISQGASEQASAVEEVSSTMEEISSNIETNTANSSETEQISKRVVEEIKNVNLKAQKAQEFNKLIAQKITAINDIAFQTNILSLNAAIEASKAGEYGKGFSVVADQVRKLAESSKLMAEEIVGLVNDSVKLTSVAGENIQSIIPTIEKTSTLVQDITAAGVELTSGVHQVNAALQQINSSTVQNAAGSEELAAGAKELSSQSSHLMELVAYFRLDDHIKPKKKEISAEDLIDLTGNNDKSSSQSDAETKTKSTPSATLPQINMTFKELEEYEQF